MGRRTSNLLTVNQIFGSHLSLVPSQSACCARGVRNLATFSDTAPGRPAARRRLPLKGDGPRPVDRFQRYRLRGLFFKVGASVSINHHKYKCDRSDVVVMTSTRLISRAYIALADGFGGELPGWRHALDEIGSLTRFRLRRDAEEEPMPDSKQFPVQFVLVSLQWPITSVVAGANGRVARKAFPVRTDWLRLGMSNQEDARAGDADQG
jgi:hypothetical protein